MTDFSLDFPYAYGGPRFQADFRTLAEDFVVNETLGFTPTGTGEHVYLQVTKRGENTDWVVQQIAQLAGVRPMDVGYAGLKDRHAVTTQWFSVYLPKAAEPDWAQLNTDTTCVHTVARHSSKLRRGAHQGNDFVIRLRNVQPVADGSEVHHATDLSAVLADQIDSVASIGVPNYFGEQRFGRGGNNLNLAQRWFVDGEEIRKRSLRGLVLSAARSYIFNQVLAKRVIAGSWADLIDGDIPDAAQPTGPLWGRGRSLVSAATGDLESAVLVHLAGWLDSLEHQGLSQERRALVLLPNGFAFEQQGGDVQIAFSLPPGTYATVVLRELFQLNNVANVQTSPE